MRWHVGTMAKERSAPETAPSSWFALGTVDAPTETHALGEGYTLAQRQGLVHVHSLVAHAAEPLAYLVRVGRRPKSGGEWSFGRYRVLASSRGDALARARTMAHRGGYFTDGRLELADEPRAAGSDTKEGEV